MASNYYSGPSAFPATMTVQGAPGSDTLMDFKDSAGKCVLKITSNGDLVHMDCSEISIEYFQHLNIFAQTCIDTVQMFIDNPSPFNHCRVADMAIGGAHCGMEFRSMCTFFERQHGTSIAIVGELSRDLLTCIEFIAAFQSISNTK